ncbi:T9SS type A sorting domain-containing protein [Flavobacterium sp.]
MRKILLLSFLALGFSSKAQTVLFEDGFETYNNFIITGIGNWTTLDLDLRPTYTGGTVGNPTWANANAAQAFQVFNPTAAAVSNATSGDETRNFTPHIGSKYAASWAAEVSATVLANEDWLISPPITLGASENLLTVFMKSMSDSYGLEEYSIGIYFGTGNPSSSDDFVLHPDAINLLASFDNWDEVVLSLDEYSGQTIRIGIRNEGADHYMLMVDDFKVETGGLGVNQIFSNKFSVFPNPVNNVVNISNTESIVLNSINISDINGRTVKQMNFENVNDAQINVSDLSSGIYFINIGTDSGNAVKKFIKN